jgi:hypothetical protein
VGSRVTSAPFGNKTCSDLNACNERLLIQGGAEKRENFKLTMRFRPAVKFLLHTQYARGFVTLKRLVRL